MKKLIGSKGFYKMVLAICIPIVIQNGFTNLASLLDNIMIGQLGTLSMSGVSITNQLLQVFNVTIFGAMSGPGIFMAQFYGKKNKEGVENCFRIKLIIGIIIALLAIFLFYTFGQQLISLYLNDYSNANFTHFCEIIQRELGVKISDTTLNYWLRRENVISPKARRRTKKNMKRLLKARLDNSNSNKVKNSIKESIALIDEKNAHPRRPRSKYAGEMIQMDASSFKWIDNEVWYLHVAIDDADGKIVGAYFDYQETLNGYYNVLYQILNNHGIPALFYTDKRTIFEYKRKNRAFDDEDTFTQFSYACHNLGIDIKTTSVPQAKGRIERLNQTLQSRLPVELKSARVTNIEKANEFLNSYIKKFNDQFALQLNTTKSVYEKQPDIEKINHTLAVLSPRKIDTAHCIRFKNRYYLPVSNKGTKRYFTNKTDCMVIESFDGSLYVNILDTLYLMEEVPEHESFSKEFDDEIEENKPSVKKKYIPPMTHPWKRMSFNNYVQKQKHRSGANV